MRHEPNAVCGTCKKPFWVKLSQIAVGKGKYCSRICYMVQRSRWMRDKDFNPTYKIDFKGKNNPNYKDSKIRCKDCGKAFTYNSK